MVSLFSWSPSESGHFLLRLHQTITCSIRAVTLFTAGAEWKASPPFPRSVYRQEVQRPDQMSHLLVTQNVGNNTNKEERGGGAAETRQVKSWPLNLIFNYAYTRWFSVPLERRLCTSPEIYATRPQEEIQHMNVGAVSRSDRQVSSNVLFHTAAQVVAGMESVCQTPLNTEGRQQI